MKLYVVFSTVHLQKETLKNNLKTTQNPPKQPPGGVLKKVVLKNFTELGGQHHLF